MNLVEKTGKNPSGNTLGNGKCVAYYPGCSLEGLAGEYDISTREVARALGKSIREIPDWSCCGSTPAHSADPVLSGALAGRNLVLAAENGCDLVMTPCPGCLKSLKGANEVFRDEKKRDEFLGVLGMPYDGSVQAVSVLQWLLEEVGLNAVTSRVVRPLTGLRLAPYYGCLISRPAHFARFDDPENPVSMDRLLSACGATVLDFPYKTECCGATYGVTRNDIVGRLTGRILDMAERVEAEAIVVACPLCQQNLDLRQEQVNRREKRSFKMPVLYITQVIGLAFGLSPKALGWNKLFVNADALLRPAPETRDAAEVFPALKTEGSAPGQSGRA